MNKSYVWLVVLVLGFAPFSPCRSACALDDAPLVEAKERVARASDLFEHEDYAAALAEFERVLELLGAHPSRAAVLHNIGQCHERMFEYDQALRFYHSYIEESGPDAPEREGVKATIRTLEGLLATLQVSADFPATEVWIDGRRVGTAPLQLRVPGGRHVIEGRAEGRTSAWREVLIAAGTARKINFTMAALPKARRVPKSLFWTAAALSGATLATGITLGAVTMRQRADLRSRLRDDDTRFSVDESDKRALARRAHATDALFISAGVLSVSTVILYYFTDFAPVQSPVRIGLDQRTLSISGSF